MINQIEWQEAENKIIQSLPSKDFHSRAEWQSISIKNYYAKQRVLKDVNYKKGE